MYRRRVKNKNPPCSEGRRGRVGKVRTSLTKYKEDKVLCTQLCGQEGGFCCTKLAALMHPVENTPRAYLHVRGHTEIVLCAVQSFPHETSQPNTYNYNLFILTISYYFILLHSASRWWKRYLRYVMRSCVWYISITWSAIIDFHFTWHPSGTRDFNWDDVMDVDAVACPTPAPKKS